MIRAAPLAWPESSPVYQSALLLAGGGQHGDAQEMAPDMPVVVTLPAEIDFTVAEEVTDQICAAFAPGVTAVAADLTATTFCDSSGIRHLLLASERASATGVQLRFAVPPGGPVQRVLKLTGVHRVLAVYPTLDGALAT
jgi:anti-anti-sigma factor